MMQMLDTATMVEWTAFGVGTVGSILWAFGRSQVISALLWMLSSVIWIAFALTHEHYGLTSNEVIGFTIYAVGLRTYWVERKARVVSECTGGQCKSPTLPVDAVAVPLSRRSIAARAALDG